MVKYRKKFVKKNYKKKTYKKGWGSKIMNYISDPLGSGYKVPLVKAVKGIGGLLNAEKKYKDHAITSAITNTPSFLKLNDPAQGDGASERNGDSIKGKTLTITVQLAWNTAGANYQTIRLVLLKYNRENNTPAWSDVFENIPSGVYHLQNKDPTKMSYSKLLLDKKFILSANRPSIIRKYTFKVPYHVQFTTGTTTINMGLILLGSVSDTTANHPGVSVNTRYRYIDN